MSSICAASLSLGLSFALLRYAESRPHEGPTAAALDEGFSAALGAGLGLVIGSALGAALVRRGSRVLSGSAAGLVAYVTVVAPVFVVTGPSDVSYGESLNTAAYFLIPVLLLVVAGAAIGALTATFMHREPGVG